MLAVKCCVLFFNWCVVMSRIGQKIIELPDNVEANLGKDEIKLTGPKGELSAPIFEGANIEIADKTITVNKSEDDQDFLKNITGGVGLNWDNLIIDYSFSPAYSNNSLGNNHLITINLSYKWILEVITNKS